MPDKRELSVFPVDRVGEKKYICRYETIPEIPAGAAAFRGTRFYGADRPGRATAQACRKVAQQDYLHRHAHRHGAPAHPGECRPEQGAGRFRQAARRARGLLLLSHFRGPGSAGRSCARFGLPLGHRQDGGHPRLYPGPAERSGHRPDRRGYRQEQETPQTESGDGYRERLSHREGPFQTQGFL